MKYKFKASYTVEAACILPLVLGVIVMIIYLGFFLHDRTLLTETAYMAALKGSFIEHADNERIEYVMQSECENALDGGLLVLSNRVIEVNVTRGSVSVMISGEMQIPLLGVLEQIGIQGVLPARAKEELKRIEPVNTIRLYRITEGLVSE